MKAFDFSYQLTVSEVETVATDMVKVTGNCYDGVRSFVVDGDYKVGDSIFVMGYLIMGNYQVISHGFIH